MTSFLPGRRTLLFIGSLLFSLYVLAPIGWLVSSSFQSAHSPASAIGAQSGRTITYGCRTVPARRHS